MTGLVIGMLLCLAGALSITVGIRELRRNASRLLFPGAPLWLSLIAVGLLLTGLSMAPFLHACGAPAQP